MALGGDASTATNGFWSALNIATTLALPMLFYIEDNAFGISVPSSLQTPGGNIAANLRAFSGLTLLEGRRQRSGGGRRAGSSARWRTCATERSPALLRLTVPRLSGHSGQDTQAYKSAETLREERARRSADAPAAVPGAAAMSEAQWTALAEQTRGEVEAAVDRGAGAPAA